MDEVLADRFEEHRPGLRTVAYRTPRVAIAFAVEDGRSCGSTSSPTRNRLGRRQIALDDP